jgi:ABC-type transporter Mla subunit MlaD
VAAIALDRSDFGRVRIELKIEPGIEIPAASRAYFQRVGVTGQRAIDITGGTLAGGRLAPGSTIPRGETTLEALEAHASGLGDEVSTLVAEARQAVRDAQRVIVAVDPERVAAVVDAVDPQRMAALLMHSARAAKRLDSASEQIGQMLRQGRAYFGDLTHAGESFAARATAALEHANSVSLELSRLLDVAGSILHANEDDVRAAIGNIRGVSQDARALVRALRARPSLLLHAKPPRERELR